MQVSELIKEIDMIHSLVSQIFAWHPLMYELIIIRHSLMTNKETNTLSKTDKREFLKKIDKWKKLLV